MAETLRLVLKHPALIAASAPIDRIDIAFIICFLVFPALRLGRCRGRVRFAVFFLAPLNGATSKLFPSVVEIATGLAGSTFSNSSTGLSRIRANEFPCRTSILIISGDSLYIQCVTVQAPIFYPNIGSRGDPPNELGSWNLTLN